MNAIVDGADLLADQPRLGTRLDRYATKEIRRKFVGPYEVRYEIRGSEIVILRLWRGRELR
ncbi:MAG: type II toxin-antitoxin system RelE/ParE family toxin [Alphaproteobacteria bacterium]|nr:type II toxin-antitoxin system RelE/ParE family toxin [Alphaproteobacteria bacterium]